MWDLIVAAVIVAVLSVVLFQAGRVFARRLPVLTAGLALAAAAWVVWFATTLHGTLAMATIVPFENAIILSNAIPFAAALLAGIIGAQPAVPWWRRTSIAAILVGLAWWTNLCHFFREPQASHDLWSVNRVCLQTTPSSCSACYGRRPEGMSR